MAALSARLNVNIVVLSAEKEFAINASPAGFSIRSQENVRKSVEIILLLD